MKQEEYIGFGSIKHLAGVLSKLSTKKVFLVTGKDSYRSSGAEKYMANLLVGCEVVRFFEFSSNPKVEDFDRGISLFKKVKPDAVIAVGGGSVIDMAKLINFFAGSNLTPFEYIKKKLGNEKKPKPLIAIPTTAGSGSEATSFAVLYKDKKKYSVENQSLLPDVAIVDPDLTMSLPKYITASTGMDALSQAIESYWSINSNAESKSLAKVSIELIRDNLEKAVNSTDASSRLAMARAAHLSGKAINITKTTAPHAVSYPLTSYFGIPHGHAVGLTLSLMLEYISEVNEEDLLDGRGCQYVQKSLIEICGLFGSKDIHGAKEKIDSLINTIGLETKLSKLGIRTSRDIDIIIENGFNPERVRNNPRRVTKQALRKILRAAQ